MTKNAIVVYTLLLEFLKFQKTSRPIPYTHKVDGLHYTIFLIEIVEKFILSSKLDPYLIFDAVCDASLRKEEDVNFLVYKSVLLKAKRDKYKDLIFLFTELKKFPKKKSKTL